MTSSTKRSGRERRTEVISILADALLGMWIEERDMGAASRAAASGSKDSSQESHEASSSKRNTGAPNTRTGAAERDIKPADPAATPELIEALARMAIDELVAKFREVFGRSTRSRNEPYLRKRLAWRITQLGRCGESAIASSSNREDTVGRQRVVLNISKLEKSTGVRGRNTKRDVRLPKVGSVLSRVYQGERYEVRVMHRGFEYRGARYGSLSKIATEITGTIWNGFAFFGLQHRRAAKARSRPMAIRVRQARDSPKSA
jgi:hypothetical protein